MTEVCSCCKTIPGRRSQPRPPKSATAADIVIGTAMKTRKGTFWRPQGPLIKMCRVCMDATFHGGSNDIIGGRGRLRRPEISPIYPLQLSPILGSSPPPWRPCSLSPVLLSPPIFDHHQPPIRASWADTHHPPPEDTPLPQVNYSSGTSLGKTSLRPPNLDQRSQF